jgi:prolyl 4-hydroxylase
LYPAGGFEVASGESKVSDYRKTDICFFQPRENPLIATIEERCSKLTKMPEQNGEGLQYGRYTKGFYYHSHYDFADPAWGGGVNNFLSRGGQRVVTVLMYLATLPEGVGGQTYFMDHNPPLTFTPTQGKALVFYNVITDIAEDGKPIFSAQCDYSTKHEAVEITADNITKHIMTKWYRENTFV